MRTVCLWVLFGAVAVLASGCQILSYSWTTPTTVAAGSVFAMDVTGVTDYSFADAWAVFELPNGFEVLGAGFVANPGRIQNTATVTTTAAALAPYVANPGHQLAAVSGMAPIVQSQIAVDAKVYVRAPDVAGTYTLRMALAVGTAGALQPQLGLTSFQTPTGAATRTVVVQAAPPAQPFSLAPAGLCTQPRPAGATVADVDRDGRADVMLVNLFDVRVFRAVPGGFTLAATLPLPFQAHSPIAMTADDLDGDGWIDLVNGQGQIWFGGSSSWTAGPQLPLGQFYFTGVGTGDFDDDGNVDIAVAGHPSLAIFRGLGNRTFAAALPLPSVLGGNLLVDDLDADGRKEVVLWGGGNTELWHTNGAGSWQLGGSLPTTIGACVIAGFGQPGRELVLSGSTAHYRWNGQTLLAVPGQQALTFDRVTVGDFDRDGADDILTAHHPSFAQPVTLRLWRRAGATQFTSVALPTVAGFRILGGIDALLSGDIDGDTWPDAFAAMDAPLAWHNTYTGAASYGSGCGGAAAAPSLESLGTVGVGQNVQLRLSSALPGALSVFWAGSSFQSLHGLQILPLSLAPFGAPGCFLLAEPIDVVPTFADSAGIATLPVALPPLPSTWQVTVYSQAAVLDLAANPLGGRFSAGLALKIQ